MICTIGEAISRLLQTQAGLGMEDAGSYVSMLLVLTSVILTGFNLYGSLAKFGGAGALVPITGFANAMVSPALEFKS